jgi:hypothetical protein
VRHFVRLTANGACFAEIGAAARQITAPIGRRTSDRACDSLPQVKDPDAPPASPAAELLEAPPEVHGPLVEEPPVVARLVIEIRSDGSRTIARGALEDVSSGQRTAIEAHGASPLQLALALARSLSQLPKLTARSVVRGLLGRGRPPR